MNKKPLFKVLSGALLIFALPLMLLAAEFRAGDQVSVQTDETISGDVYAAGGMVTHSGTVSGDLYAGGGTVLISGDVWEDAVIGGGTITISGDIGDDVRAGGGTIVIQGAVAGDILVGGGQVHITGSGVGGDIVAGAGTLRIDAPVSGLMRIGGGIVYLNAPVVGDVFVDADKLTLGNKAAIGGNLSYRSPQEAVIETGAKVSGKTSYEPRAARTKPRTEVAASIGWFLMLLTASLLFGLLFKRYMTELARGAHAQPFTEVGRGLVAFIVLPVASVLLLITVIGVPLGLLGLIAFAGALLFSILTAPILLGTLFYRWTIKTNEFPVNWKSILLGVFVYFILCFIPLIGWVAQAILVLLTLGSAVRMKWDIAKTWR